MTIGADRFAFFKFFEHVAERNLKKKFAAPAAGGIADAEVLLPFDVVGLHDIKRKTQPAVGARLLFPFSHRNFYIGQSSHKKPGAL